MIIAVSIDRRVYRKYRSLSGAAARTGKLEEKKNTKNILEGKKAC